MLQVRELRQHQRLQLNGIFSNGVPKE